LVWKPGLVLGSANAAYFGANTFLPGYLNGAGRPDLVGDALSALNIGQLPASFLLLALASRFERKVWPFVAMGVGALACILGMVTTANYWTVAFAGGLGFCAAAVLALSLALPALLRAPADVAPTSAAMFVIGYAQAMLASTFGGAAWDAFGHPAYAFLPVAIAGLPLVLLPRTIGLRKTG
jgi:CP family cyanate transporter-like MFS transporter